MHNEPRIPFELPLIEAKTFSTGTHVGLIISVLKKQLSNILEGHKIEFETELRKIADEIYEAGYSNGLRDMDLMHGNIDKKELWQKDTE
jgi:hypothetical protein